MTNAELAEDFLIEGDAMNNYREAGYALLRVTLGMIFLTTGIVKLMMGVGTFAAGVQQAFAGKLPMLIVTPFAYVLPFVEVAVGALLVLGLFNVSALVLAGLLLIGLTFGMTLANEVATIAHNLSYVLINFVLLWLAEHNGYSIDRLRRSRPARSGSNSYARRPLVSFSSDAISLFKRLRVVS